MGNIHSIKRLLKREKPVKKPEEPKRLPVTKVHGKFGVPNRVGKKVESVKGLNEMQACLHIVCDRLLEVVSMHLKLKKLMRDRPVEEIDREGRNPTRRTHAEIQSAIMEIIRSVLELKMDLWRYYANVEHI